MGVRQVKPSQRGALLEDVQVARDVGVSQVERLQGSEFTELLGQGTVEITAVEVDPGDVAALPGQNKRMARGDASPRKADCGCMIFSARKSEAISCVKN